MASNPPDSPENLDEKPAVGESSSIPPEEVKQPISEKSGNSDLSNYEDPIHSETEHKQKSLAEERQVSKEIDQHADVEKNGLSNGATVHLSNGEDGNIHDKNIVWWNEPVDQDPENPMNWSARKKWVNITILSAITFVTPLASSIFAPVVPNVMAEFHNNSQILATFVVSVYLLGFAFGPLILAPLSEMYGRLPLYNISNIFFIGFSVGCALSTSLNMLIGFRVLAGLAGCTCLTIGGGTIADLVPQEKRGGVMALWSLGPLLGPIIGPVGGGYLGQAKGWRWVFWLLVILSGFFSLLALIFCRETYAPVLLERKTLRLRKETGNPDLRSKLDTGLTPIDLFKRSLIRPTKLLLLSPVCTILCAFTAIAYGELYLLFTTFTYVFEGQYHFSSGTVGLTYIGIGIGLIFGGLGFGAVSDKILKAKAKQGEMKPEYRLPLMVPGSFCIPMGLFIYGWTVQYHEHWAVPLVGTLILGLGLMSVFMAIQTYLVDTYTLHAASAIAANTVLRSLLGTCFPLFGLQMYSALGLGWGNSLLGFIALAMCPIPILLLKYGESIRKNPRFQVQL